ncbi:MAG: lysylphosphatidylglycerol synthase transmembrane domain-containing protein [Actinomycetota bacterium]
MAHHTTDHPRSPQAPNAAPVAPSHVHSAEEAAGEIQVEVRSKRGAILLRLAFLAVTVVALYILWPSLLSVFETWPELLDLNPGWFVAMFALEGLSFLCIWGLQRIALRTKRWFGVATAQLAANAFSRVVPGGAAAGGALQWRMLTDSGVDGARVATALTAASLISTGTLFMLPVLTLPAALLGRPVPGGLAQAAWLGGVVFVVAFVLGWRLLFHNRLLRRIGRGAQWLRNRLQRGKPPVTDLPARLVVQRDEIRDALGDTWWEALLFSLGNWLFDYLALLAAITAVGSRPRPTLVLLAYSASMVLAMIPITPGGLGFVEAGLTGLLALAGVSAGDAVLAVLAYRLVSFWLPLPAGGVAAYLHRRRYRGRETIAEPG